MYVIRQSKRGHTPQGLESELETTQGSASTSTISIIILSTEKTDLFQNCSNISMSLIQSKVGLSG